MGTGKPSLLYFVHTHGNGHRARFRMLYPALQQAFTVIALTTNDAITADLRTDAHLKIIQLPPKAPPDMVLQHTFSKAFEATPYGIEAAERVSALAAIVKRYRPVALYCDGLPELAILARGMGTPVVLTHLHGNVMSDPTQVFAHELADHIVAHFPKVLEQPDYDYAAKTFYSGYISQYASIDTATATDPDIITILLGFDNYDEAILQNITADNSRQFVIIGNNRTYSLPPHCRQLGRVPDIASSITGDVVITAAGQNSTAELVSLNKRLIMLPEPRPYDEQHVSTQSLVTHNLALQANPAFSANQWKDIIDQAQDFSPDYTGLVNKAAPADITNQLKQWYA